MGNNNNNTNASVYGAHWCCYHGKAIVRVHPVHLMNIERRQASTYPQTKLNNLGCESACRLPESTPTIAIYYYYLAKKLIFILPSCGGKKG